MKRKVIINGFTLIELILYVALVSVFATAAISFAWNVIYGREKSFNQQIVQQNARAAMLRISYEIRRAKDIQSISGSQIVLNDGGAVTTTISQNGQSLQVTSNGIGPYNLTSNQVVVTSLNFTNLTTTTNDSKNIKVNFSLQQAKPAVSTQTVAQTSLEETVELNSQFNQARQLLANYSSVVLAGGTSLQGVTLQNSDTTNIIIDKVIISWTGTPGGEQVTGVQIGGGTVEWTGSAGSGSTIDLTNYSLAAADGAVAINYITFSSNISGATLSITYILGDGSKVKTQLVLPSGPTSTPTPTQTPTPTPTPTIPPSSCNAVCISRGYSLGTCRKNAQDCSTRSEVYVSSGDVYCTGGANADTCCCRP